MNGKTNLSKPEYTVSSGPRVKSLAKRFVITTEPNWERELKRAFDLAKSAGQELDVTFCLSDAEKQLGNAVAQNCASAPMRPAAQMAS